MCFLDQIGSGNMEGSRKGLLHVVAECDVFFEE